MPQSMACSASAAHNSARRLSNSTLAYAGDQLEAPTDRPDDDGFQQADAGDRSRQGIEGGGVEVPPRRMFHLAGVVLRWIDAGDGDRSEITGVALEAFLAWRVAACLTESGSAVTLEASTSKSFVRCNP